jgi:hypothetical protein
MLNTSSPPPQPAPQDRVGKPAEHGMIGQVDPQCRMIFLHIYGGMLKVIPFDAKGHLCEAFNIRYTRLVVCCSLEQCHVISYGLVFWYDTRRIVLFLCPIALFI